MMDNKAIFPTEEDFRRIMEECIERGEPRSSEQLRERYQDMIDMFGKYIESVREDMFRFAYQCGYETAMNEMLGWTKKRIKQE